MKFLLYISLPFVCYVIGYQLYKYYLWFRLNYKLTKMRENDHELKQAISDLKNNQFFYKKETINSIIESANQVYNKKKTRKFYHRKR